MFNKIISINKNQIILFTGGTAANSFTGELHKLTNNLTYIIPISDNGGSTGVIQEFIGGPAIGDIRSRLIRLAENGPMKEVLKYRLPTDTNIAFTEWNNILSMNHPVWNGVPQKFRDIIKAGLINFNSQIQKKINANKQFNFSNGSIGNFFFSGQRLYFGSLSATIETFKHVLGINKSTQVQPVIDLDENITIGVKLANNDLIKGQNEISHPSTSNVVDKNYLEPLSAKVQKLFYLDNKGNLFYPVICDEIYESILNAKTIIYSMGSFYTSLLPSLITKGIGEAIVASDAKKIFIANGNFDRETTFLSEQGLIQKLSLHEQLTQLTLALNRYGELTNSITNYLTDIIYLQNGEIAPSESEQEFKLHIVASEKNNNSHYDSKLLSEKIFEIANY